MLVKRAPYLNGYCAAMACCMSEHGWGAWGWWEGLSERCVTWGTGMLDGRVGEMMKGEKGRSETGGYGSRGSGMSWTRSGLDDAEVCFAGCQRVVAGHDSGFCHGATCSGYSSAAAACVM